MSRLRSSRASNSSASRSTPAARGPRGVLVQSPKSDVYVALLGIALASILIGCLLMTLVLMRYEWKVSVSANTPTPTVGQPAEQLALTTVAAAGFLS